MLRQEHTDISRAIMPKLKKPFAMRRCARRAAAVDKRASPPYTYATKMRTDHRRTILDASAAARRHYLAVLCLLDELMLIATRDWPRWLHAQCRVDATSARMQVRAARSRPRGGDYARVIAARE